MFPSEIVKREGRASDKASTGGKTSMALHSVLGRATEPGHSSDSNIDRALVDTV